jgi:predicted flap endonuclease-1-like 5' DNA nuclease
MDALLNNPFFYWIMWSVATLIGVLIGWSIRFILSEKRILSALERSEQDRNSLARLYTQLKHQYDLREADLKKSALEVAQLRHQTREFELLNNLQESEKQTSAARLEKAEHHIRHLMEKNATIQAQQRGLIAQNQALAAEATRKTEEAKGWRRLYLDFSEIHLQIKAHEDQVLNLEQDQIRHNEQISAYLIEIENLQLELLRLREREDSPIQEEHHLGETSAPPSDNFLRNVRKPNSRDDLKIINGISPFIEKKLYALGVFSFEQISQWDDAALISAAKSLETSPARLLEEDWVGQARHLIEQSI